VVSFADNLAAHFGLSSSQQVTQVLLLIALVLVPGALAVSAAYASRIGSRADVPVRELLCRLSLSLVPVGVAMWAAHFLFHFASGWGSAWTIVQRAASEAGWHLPNLPGAGFPLPGLSSESVRALQTLLLDVGLLLALYLAWRISLVYAPRARHAFRMFAPWAAIATALYAVGVWIILQPMQMRGLPNPLSFK
jgi:hypothetical protein